MTPWREQKRFLTVHGHAMAYVERGKGDPIVLLHGNPTSSFLWRDVIPYLEGLGRCIAPDLLGMGDSAKLPIGGLESYDLATHQRQVEGLLEALGVRERVILVLHDWGGALGFDWARRHPERVRGIAYMETIVAPREWSDWPEPAQAMFRMLRTPAGEKAVLEDNAFVERMPQMVLRGLTEQEMDEYRRPFREPGESRRATLEFPRLLPVGGEPPEVVAVVKAYSEWLATTPIPKLFVSADPGASISGRLRAICRAWPAQTEITVRGRHFVQEDSAAEIGRGVAAWMRTLR